MKRMILFILLSVMALGSQSQGWMKYLPLDKQADKTLTFYDYQEAFNQWCEELNIDNTGYYTLNGEKHKAYGWKQFKRWEWERRGYYDLETGKFHEADIFKAMKEYYLEYPSVSRDFDGDWVSLGYAQSNGGYYGQGRLNTIGFHPTNPDIFWVGAPTGGLWYTSDHGSTWSTNTDDLAQIGISAIAIQPDFATSQTMYIGTGDRDNWVARGIGVLKSTDGGQTWNNTGLTFTNLEEEYVGRIIIHPTNYNIVFVLTSEGFYKSTNGGATFIRKAACYGIDMELNPSNPDTIYISITHTIAYLTRINRSVDAGESWETVFTGVGLRTELAVSPDEPRRVYAIVSNIQGGLDGIYRSTESGENFLEIFDGDLPNQNLLCGRCAASEPGGQGSYDLCIAANPKDGDEVFIGGVNVWKSTDGGFSWDISAVWTGTCEGTVETVHADHHWLEYQHDTDTLFNCNDGGIYFTHDGGVDWHEISDGLVINQLYRLSCSQSRDDEIIMGLQDNSTKVWTDGGYYEIGDGDGVDCLIDPDDDNIQYHCSCSGRPEVTTDHWATVTTFGSVPDQAGWFRPYRLFPDNTNNVLWAVTNLWISYDRGENFYLFADLPDSINVLEVQIAPSNPQVIFVSNEDNFYKTINGGQSWTDITANLPFDPENLCRIEIKQDDENVLWATNIEWDDGKCVFKSVDGGYTWQNISDGLPDIPFYDIIQNNLVTTEVELYASSDAGVFVKPGDGIWLPFNQGLPNVRIFDLDIHYDGTNTLLRAGTWGRGFWETPVFSTSGSAPGEWIGNVSSSWDNINNWKFHKVPSATENVTIPAGCLHYPEIYSSEQCNKLTIEAGAMVTISQSGLRVNDSLNIYGTMNFNGNATHLTLHGDVVINPGADIIITDPNLAISAYRNWKVLQGADGALTKGKISFLGSSISTITIQSATWVFNNITIGKDPGVQVYISEFSTAKFIVNGTLEILAGSEFVNQASNDTEINTKFINSGTYKFYSGTLKYTGSSMSLSSSTTSYFHSFQLSNSTCTFTLNSDITIKGDLWIARGTIDPQNYTISLQGNWMRMASTGVFDHTSGRVAFIGANEQIIVNSEEFYTIELNKSGESLLINGQDIACAHYDWTAGTLALESGSFTANDLSDDGIFGNYIQSGGTIDLYNDEYIDLNGFITITDGIFNVHGGFRASYWPYSANAGLTMSGGVLDFTDQSIYLNDVGISFPDIITGGVIRTAGGFGGARHDFNPAGGYIELYGTSSALLGHGIGSSFYEVKVNKGTAADHSVSPDPSLQKEMTGSEVSELHTSDPDPALSQALRIKRDKTGGRVEEDGTIYPGGGRSTRVTVNSTLDVDRDITIQSGELDISGQIVDLEGNLVIDGCLTMTDPDGELHVGRKVEWKSAATENVTAGNIWFGRDWWFGYFGNQHLSGTNIVTADGDSIQNILFSGNNNAFMNLVIDKPASYVNIDNLLSDTLKIDDDLQVKSGNTLKTLRNCRLKADSLFIVESGATVDLESNSIAIATTKLQLDGTMNLNTTPKMYCKKSFLQGSTGHLVINGGSFIIDAPCTYTLHGFAGTTDLNGGNFEITNDGIQLGVGAVYNFNGGNMRIGWGFKAIYAGCFQPSQGTVELMGNRLAEINLQNGNYFHNLMINKGTTYSVNVVNPFTVDNDLTITSGTLNMIANKLTINNDLVISASGKLDPGSGEVDIAGDWTNNRGPVGLTEGTSTVTFIGNNNSYLNTDETFYNLKLNKPAAAHKNLYVPESITCTVEQDLTVSDGTVKPGNNTIFNIGRNLSIASGAGFDAGYVAQAAVTINLSRNWNDNNSAYGPDTGFNPGTSSVIFNGSSSQAYSSIAPCPFYNLTVDKPSEYVNVKSNLLVLNDFLFTSGTMNYENANTQYEFGGDVTFQQNSVWMDNTSKIRFIGTGTQTYLNQSTSPVSFRDLEVDMTEASETGNQVVLGSDISLLRDVRVSSGELILGGHSIECGRVFQVTSEGKVNAADNSIIKMKNDGQLIINGGVIDLYGDGTGNALVTHISAGNYMFTVQAGGTLNAENTIFEYMGTDGLNITATGILGTRGTLKGCTFRNGISGGKLLTVENNQNLKIYDAIFPANTWGGSYNVSKTNASGLLTFINESGGFAGPGYENDPLGNRIYWSLSGRWTGTVSHVWGTNGNWYYNNVPDISTVVYIPAAVPYSPWIQSNASCKSLTLEVSAYLKIDNLSLTVHEEADIFGIMHVDSNAVLTVDSLVLEPGSHTTDDYRAQIKVNGDLFIAEDALVDLTQSSLYFISPKNSTITNQADTAWFYAFLNRKPSGYTLTYGSGSTGVLVVRGNFTNNMDNLANVTFLSDSPQEIIFQGRFRNINGYIKCNDGTLTLAGDPYYDLRTNDGSNFNNLTIRTTTHLKLDNTYTDSLVVNGTLQIESNITGSSGLEARASVSYPAMPVIVKGNWINNVGTTGFVHGNGKVEFNRTTGHQEIHGHTQFYKVYERTSGTYRLKFYNTNDIIDSLVMFNRTAVYDTIMVYNLVDLSRSSSYLYLEENGYVETEGLDQGGHMVANSGFFMNYDLTDDDINGDYQLHGGSISLTQDGSSPIDFNASVFISDGEFWVYGGNGTSNWPSPTGTAYVRMTGGVLGVSGQGIYIYSDDFTESISGGIIKTNGDFQTYDAVTTFHPTGGTVELYGNSNKVTSMFGPGCSFWNLKINKDAAYQVTAADYIRIKGELRIASGKFKTNGEIIQIGP